MITIQEVKKSIPKLKTLSRLTAFISLASALFMAGLIVAGFLLISLSKNLPKTDEIKGIELKIPLRVYSADGFLISEFGNERRNPLEIDKIPEALKQAVLASEDDNFYSHRGIDITGLIRAALSNFKSDGNLQGASTITMQVARNFFLSREQTYERKLKEILLSFKLERLLSKDDILALYLNKIFLGHRAYGFGAAANVYYGKQLDELSLAEIAMLAGLPKAPSSNNPISNPKRAEKRRNYVLKRMFDLQLITSEAFETAKSAPITAAKHGSNVELPAYHIAEMVRSALIDTLGEQAYWEGLNVHTTVMSEPQFAAIKSLRKGLQDYDKRHGYRGAIKRTKFDQAAFDANQDGYIESLLIDIPSSQKQEPALISIVKDKTATAHSLKHGAVTLSLEDAKWAKRFINQNVVGKTPNSMTHILNPGDIVYIQPKQTDKPTDKVVWELSQIPTVSGALISMEPTTGKILSLVGGYDFFLNKYNRAVQAIRQPGSNIKPFIYSAGIDQGLTPASQISGAPIVMTDPVNGTVWRPENYSGEFYGPTRMRHALAKSMNLVSIRILRAIGIPVAREYLERFGLKMDRFSSSLTMALGSGGVTPLELISAYSALANTGYRIEPYFIERITDRHGEVIYQTKPPILCDECYQQYLPKAVDENQNITEPTNEPEKTDEQQNTQKPTEVRQIVAPRIMSRANNYLTVSMMKDVITSGTAKKALVLKRNDLAGKTGTTNDYVDAWFTGFNQSIVTTVWVGFDDPSTMGRGEAGSRTALPIWIDYMKTALKDVPEDTQELPEYIGEGWVDSATSRLTEEGMPNAIKELYPIEEMLPEPFARINGYTGETLDPNDVNSIDGLDDDSLNPEEDPELLKNRIIESDEDTDGLF